jgi:hypothetical protein
MEIARFVKCVTLKMANVHKAASSLSEISSALHVTDTLWVNQVSYVLFAGIRIR